MGGETSTPLTPTQKMMVNLRWLRDRGASSEEQQAEIARWQPKIEAYNRAERSQAASPANLAVRGFTAGFSDEIAGAADAAGAMLPGGQSPGEAYRTTRDAIRSTNEAYAAENPGKALTAELGGALAGGIGVGAGAGRAVPGALRLAGKGVGLVPATTRLGRLGQAVGAGAASGALAGAGGAEGDVQDRLRGAGIGAAGGAAAGGALAGVSALGGAVARRVGLGPRAPQSAMGRVQAALGGTTADDAAAQRVLDAVEVGGRRVDDVLAPTARLDPTAVLADVDVGGERAARLAGSASRLGNEAAERGQQTLGVRASQRGVKMSGDVERITGVGRFNELDEADRLVEEARTAARPLYDRLRQFPSVKDPRVQEAVDLLPEGRRDAFWQKVRNIARGEGRNLPKSLVDGDGRLALDLEPSEMDLLKQALDEVLYEGNRAARMAQPGGISNSEARLLTRARGLLIDAAEEATGGPQGVYAQARAAYAGPVSIREALEAGADIRKLSESELARATRGMTPAQREAFNRAGIEAQQQYLATLPEGRTGIGRSFTSPLRRAQTRAVMGSGADAFDEVVQGEIAREATEQQVLRGSQTAQRLADDELVTMPLNPQRGLIGSALDAVRKPVERVVWRGSTAPEMDAAMRLLTENIGDAASREKVLRLLQQGKTARADMAARAALRRAGVAGYAGAQAGRSP